MVLVCLSAANLKTASSAPRASAHRLVKIDRAIADAGRLRVRLVLNHAEHADRHSCDQGTGPFHGLLMCLPSASREGGCIGQKGTLTLTRPGRRAPGTAGWRVPQPVNRGELQLRGPASGNPKWSRRGTAVPTANPRRRRSSHLDPRAGHRPREPRVLPWSCHPRPGPRRAKCRPAALT